MRAFNIIFALILGCCVWSAAASAADDPYLVDNVRVVPADLKAAHPDKSINDFSRADLISFVTKRAYKTLLQSLTPRETWTQHVWLKTSLSAQDALENVNVVSEVTEPSYEMIVDVQFDRQKVRNALRRFNIPFSEVSSVRILILPVFVPDGDYVLWHEFNPWRTALQGNIPAHRTVSLIFPTGDISDMRLLEPRMAVFGAADVLEAMRKKYAADYLLVAQLRPNPEDKLNVRTRWFGEGQLPFSNQAFSVTQQREKDGYAVAARQLLQGVVNQWQQAGLVAADDPRFVTYRLRVDAPEALSAFQQKLTQLTQVGRVQPQVISRGEGVYRVQFFGDLIDLNKQINGFGYNVQRDNRRWIVTLQ